MGRIGGDPSKEGTGRDRKKYAKNHPQAFGKPQPFRSGTYVMHEGELTHIEDLPIALVAAKLRAADNKNIESAAMGCSPSQIPEMKRNLAMAGISGVKIKPDGNFVIKDRQTKLKLMKARQLHDKDEIRG